MIAAFRRWRAQRGALPDELRAELEAESIVLLEERIPLEVIFRGYMIGGQRPRSGSQSERGSLALTPRRLVVHGTGGIALDVPHGATWLEITTPEPDRLRLAYDAAKLYESRSGDVEVTLDTPRAEAIHATLTEWMRTPSS